MLKSIRARIAALFRSQTQETIPSKKLSPKSNRVRKPLTQAERDKLLLIINSRPQ